jgi:hypothetical protein
MSSPDTATANIGRRRSPPNPSDCSIQTQPRRLSSNSDQSSDSSTTGFGVRQYDTEGVGGVPAGWLDQHFASLPGLHDSIGKYIAGIQWRESDIYLQNDYRTSGYRPSQQLQHISTLIADPAKSIRERQSTNQQSRNECIMQAMSKRTVLPTALWLARQLQSTDRDLASALALARERDLAWAEEQRQKRRGPTTPPQPATSPDRSAQDEEHEQHGLSDASSGSVALETIPNPQIPGPPEPSVDALFTRVNEFAKTHGFGVTKANGVVRPGQRSRYVFQCDRYGVSRPGRGAGLRKRKSRKSGCLWKIVAETLPENNFQWTLQHFPNTQHHQHNHRPSTDAAAHPVHRRLTSPVKTTIQSFSRRIGIRARDISGIVRNHFPDSVYTQKDIYNARSRLSRESLEGYSSTAALIKSFDENKVPYVAKWAKDEPNRLLGLVWTFPYCARMWRRFSEVVSFDNTYNTNRFKLPLFQVTGQTCLGTVFNAAFGLIDNERLEGFQFLATGVRTLLDQYSIRSPDVVITDFDDQMKKALGMEFPDAQQQICIHHINSNVMLQSKRKWLYITTDSSTGEESSSDEPDATLNQRDQQAIQTSERQKEPITQDDLSWPVAYDYHGVLMLWKLVVFAETEEDHEKSWERLCTQFGEQRAILAYLYRTYMPLRAQWARCFIRKYRNFGIRVTSGTEASNNNIKSYLLNGMSHLYRLVEAIQGMLEDQEREFRQSCAQDEVLTAREHVGRGSEYLGELRHIVSQKALSLIAREHRKALKGIPSPSNPWPDAIGTCNDDCTVSIELGIPCYHTIYGKLMAATSLTKWDIHPRWHLREPVSRDVYRRILDPKIATNLRGRAKNKPQPIPSSMAVGAGSQARSRQIPLGSGKTTGVRASGRRIQPNLRRQRSRWELSSDEEIMHPDFASEPASQSTALLDSTPNPTGVPDSNSTTAAAQPLIEAASQTARHEQQSPQTEEVLRADGSGLPVVLLESPSPSPLVQTFTLRDFLGEMVDVISAMSTSRDEALKGTHSAILRSLQAGVHLVSKDTGVGQSSNIWATDPTAWSGHMWINLLEVGEARSQKTTIFNMIGYMGASAWYDAQLAAFQAPLTKRGIPRKRIVSPFLDSLLKEKEMQEEEPRKRMKLASGDAKADLSTSHSTSISQQVAFRRRRQIIERVSKGRKLCTMVSKAGLWILLLRKIW